MARVSFNGRFLVRFEVDRPENEERASLFVCSFRFVVGRQKTNNTSYCLHRAVLYCCVFCVEFNEWSTKKAAIMTLTRCLACFLLFYCLASLVVP